MTALLRTGLVAALAAAVLTGLLAAVATAAVGDLEVSGSDEPIPASGVAFVTAVLSFVGLLVAIALRRWSDRPARRFVQVAAVLTALSLVPPALAAVDVATAVALVGLHLAAAAVVVPALATAQRRS